MQKIQFANSCSQSTNRDDYDEFVGKWWNENGKWHPSIHMPKVAARIFLRVTDVKAERLQDMYLADCLKEGVQLSTAEESDLVIQGVRARERFSAVWNSTVKKSDRDKYGWDANPWVWVISFERIEKPDEI